MDPLKIYLMLTQVKYEQSATKLKIVKRVNAKAQDIKWGLIYWNNYSSKSSCSFVFLMQTNSNKFINLLLILVYVTLTFIIMK